MTNRLISILFHLRSLAARHDASGQSDGELLERFVRQRDDAAFEMLVWRHGPVVLGVGRRLLHNLADAEDVFQATFLALVRQAASIRRGTALAGWLYRVAYRLALRARQQRKNQGLSLAAAEEVAAPTDGTGRDSEDCRLLDEELQRLPDKYRTPLVLSYLQGQTNREIAARLDCPIGTVFTRLARGRELLRKRLIRRGLTLSAGLLAAAGVVAPANASLRVELVRATVQAARALAGGLGTAACSLTPNIVALMKGADKMMGFRRWWMVGSVAALLAVLGSGVGLVAWFPAAAEQDKKPAAEKAEQPGKSPEESGLPKIVQVLPADGATDVEPITEIRIRFDRPMDPASAVLEWDSRSQAGFRPRGALRYVEASHEFILPVRLASDRKHEVTANRQKPAQEKEAFEGFRSKEHVAAKPYRWSFTTKKPAGRGGKAPRVVSLLPKSDTEVALLTPLEVTFDREMDPDAYGLSVPDAEWRGFNRLPELRGRAEYDAERRRFTLLIGLPPNWNGELELEGFRSKDGVEAEPIAVKYRTLRSVVSEELSKRIERAGHSAKLRAVVESVRKARRELRSVSEEARWTICHGQSPYWLTSLQTQGSLFQMQREKQFLGVVDDIMQTAPFRVGSDGTDCWFHRGKDLTTLPFREVEEKNVRICDAFNAASKADAQRVIQDMKLEYLGETVVNGRRCHRIRSWLVELTVFASPSAIREWLLDAETLLPLRVESAWTGFVTIDFTHSRVNQEIPAKEFRPESGPDIKEAKAEPLPAGYTRRFLNVVDGSNGRMSLRWGMKGPKGVSSSGLN
jgi:RNA polymerase sigma factor (sigma-70 family)